MIIWLMGISGAGKSTLGNLLFMKLFDQGHAVQIIDGDLVRNFFNNDLGYSKKDREENIKRIISAAHFLEEAKIVTVICNISPFQNLRDFCRQKFKNYSEIYLEKSYTDAMNTDFKGVYKNNTSSKVVGRDIPFENPISCDLKVSTDILTVDQALDQIIFYLKEKKGMRL